MPKVKANTNSGPFDDYAELETTFCEPSPIRDAIEDILMEVLGVKDSLLLKECANRLRENESAPPVVPLGVRAKRQIIEEFLDRFSPLNWTLLDWWAILFAIESRHIAGKSPKMMAVFFSMSRASFGKRVRNWRNKLNLGKDPYARIESLRIGKKAQREKNLARPGGTLAVGDVRKNRPAVPIS